MLLPARGDQVDVVFFSLDLLKVESLGVAQVLQVWAGEHVQGVGAADEKGGDEDVAFVDQSGLEKRGENLRTAFDEKVGVIEPGEMGQQLAQIDPRWGGVVAGPPRVR